MAPKARVEQNREPDEGVGGVGPEDRGQQDGDDDENAAHGGRAGLFQMRLGAVIADVLADLEFAQLLDDHGPMNMAMSSAVSEAKAVRKVRYRKMRKG
jgi:hypothetical protein